MVILCNQPTVKKLNPALQDREILPASLAPELIQGLLREQLGFNGLIVTDATTMAGMTIPMSRAKAVPGAIAAGCDMFLFARNLEEDYQFMKQGIENGALKRERLDDAVTRILALKASLDLPEKHVQGTLYASIDEAKAIIQNPQHQVWAKECADKAITLVKEEKGVLPLNPDKYKKVLVYGLESEQGIAYSVRAGVVDKFTELLVLEGFDIDRFKPSAGMEGMTVAFSEVTNKYDLIVYLANIGTKSNQTTVRIEWAQPMGANVPIYIESVPTVFISVENPYHLLDVPRIKTYINTYASTDETLDALMDKLMGRSTFMGTSPSDPFCGRWDTKL